LTIIFGRAFGTVLRRLRTDAGLTQEQLGLDAGLQRKYISSLELAEKEPSLLTVFKLAGALGLRPSKLIALIEKELTQDEKS
jgi:transcriptional regulator with XRE-family HTH domain